MKDKETILKEIFENDPFGLLNIIPKKSAARTSDERLASSFDEINDFIEKNEREPEPDVSNISEYKLYAEMSNHIITTSILSILVTAPIGIIIIERYGPKWLECDVSTTANTANPKNVNECNASSESLERECIKRDHAGGNVIGHGSSP